MSVAADLEPNRKPSPGSDSAIRQFAIPGLQATEDTGRILQQMAKARNLAAGETLFWEDDPTEYAYLLTDGTIKAYKLLADGRSQIIRFVVSGEVISSTFFDTHNCTAEALSPATIIQLPKQPFDKLMTIDPHLTLSMVGKLSDELSRSQRQTLLLGRMPALERVSTFLLDFATRQNANCRFFESGFTVELPMTRADIADYLGLTIETVSRIFSRFRRDGLIDLPRPNLVVISDHAGLVEHSASLEQSA